VAEERTGYRGVRGYGGYGGYGGGPDDGAGGGGGSPAAWGGMGTGWGGFQPFQGQGQSTGNEMINNHENDRNNDIHYSNSRNHF
jgi:hypothetical protein